MRAVGAVVLLLVAGSASASQQALPRSTTDRPDDVRGPQVHVVYAVPADGEDRALDTSGAIVRSVELFTQWLAGETGGPTLRVDTHRGELDITFVRLERTDAEIAARGALVRDAIEAELRTLTAKGGKIYAVYYDGSSRFACGGAFWPPALGGSVVAMYLRGAPPDLGRRCSPLPPGGELDYWEFAMLHDLLHGLGLVPRCAPNHVLSGHTGDSSNDLMWSGAGAWQLPPKLDIGRDDYYGHGRSDCPDLAKSEYLTSNPPPPPVLSAGSVVLTPARAGRDLRVSLAVFLDDRLPISATVACTLRTRDRVLKPRLAGYAQHRARCAWRIPSTERGERLVGRVRAEVEGLSVQRTFTVLVR